MDERRPVILIAKPSAIGDIVMGLAALSTVRRSFPEAKVYWLVRKEFASLLEGHPYIDELILFDRKLFGKAWRSWGAFKELWRFVGQIRGLGCDIAIDLQGLFRTGLFCRLSGAGKRVGPRDRREFASIFYTSMAGAGRGEAMHSVDSYIEIARAAGAREVDRRFVFGESKEAQAKVEGLLEANGLVKGRYAVVIAGSAHEDKCWPYERFGRVCELVRERFGYEIAAAGGAGDRGAVERVQRNCGVRIANLAGETNLLELVYLLKFAAVVVSNDTGPGHIAAALGKPLAMIYGRSNPLRVGPYGKRDSVVGVDVEGRGSERNSYDRRYDVGNIGVEEVFEVVCRQLGK